MKGIWTCRGASRGAKDTLSAPAAKAAAPQQKRAKEAAAEVCKAGGRELGVDQDTTGSTAMIGTGAARKAGRAMDMVVVVEDGIEVQAVVVLAEVVLAGHHHFKAVVANISAAATATVAAAIPAQYHPQHQQLAFGRPIQEQALAGSCGNNRLAGAAAAAAAASAASADAANAARISMGPRTVAILLAGGRSALQVPHEVLRTSKHALHRWVIRPAVIFGVVVLLET